MTARPDNKCDWCRFQMEGEEAATEALCQSCRAERDDKPPREPGVYAGVHTVCAWCFRRRVGERGDTCDYCAARGRDRAAAEARFFCEWCGRSRDRRIHPVFPCAHCTADLCDLCQEERVGCAFCPGATCSQVWTCSSCGACVCEEHYRRGEEDQVTSRCPTLCPTCTGEEVQGNTETQE